VFSLLTTGVVDIATNLSPTLLTLVPIYYSGVVAINLNLGKDVITCVVDTCNKFATGINDTGDKLPSVLLAPMCPLN
jgi:hypothetical protein